ncbi:MAG: PEGA domain-containing protein [Planctomycetes bacterium]|nr:PEGA domain-containing protein [Planctomycetota bacterium]
MTAHRGNRAGSRMFFFRGLAMSVLAALASLLSAGCVERTYRVTSTPVGAEVWLDGDQVGATPVDGKFKHYGVREFVLRREGYQTVKRRAEFEAPWWDTFPVDFFAEFLWPFGARSHLDFDYTLDPRPAAAAADADALAERATTFRRSFEEDDRLYTGGRRRAEDGGDGADAAGE